MRRGGEDWIPTMRFGSGKNERLSKTIGKASAPRGRRQVEKGGPDSVDRLRMEQREGDARDQQV